MGKGKVDQLFSGESLSEANAEVMKELYMRRKRGVILTEEIDAAFEAKFGKTYRAQGEAIGEARGVAIGEARGKVEAVLKILRARFHRVPKDAEKAIRQMIDPIASDSWAVHAATCESMDEFVKAIR